MISAPRQPNSTRVSGSSATVLAALLSALLFLSPATARVVVHILTENGVALPVQVVRVLDTATLDSLRDARRTPEEEVIEAVERAASHTPAPTHDPAPVAILPTPKLGVGAVGIEVAPRLVFWRQDRSLPLASACSRISPRAPPVAQTIHAYL